jgi:hypothetical protein
MANKSYLKTVWIADRGVDTPWCVSNSELEALEFVKDGIHTRTYAVSFMADYSDQKALMLSVECAVDFANGRH